MTPQPTILIATTNPGKLEEMRTMLGGLPVRIATLDEYPDIVEPIEDGATFEDNAAIKALHYACEVRCWVLADDSGLEVSWLDGEPGVLSARYAGADRDDRANNAKLIAKLANCPQDRPAARFRCAVALASDDNILASASGTLEGVIIDEPCGLNGFGYDPHFLVPEAKMTTAEMAPEHKNRISHRGRALRILRPMIERLLEATDISIERV